MLFDRQWQRILPQGHSGVTRANMIELVHPSAHLSPQSKWQMDRFSRFCTAYGRKCLYFTMGAPIHQIIYSEWPKFHLNPYTSGRVIAGRVNIVETCHKVFPILGKASSPSKKFVKQQYLLHMSPQCGELQPTIG